MVYPPMLARHIQQIGEIYVKKIADDCVSPPTNVPSSPLSLEVRRLLRQMRGEEGAHVNPCLTFIQ